MAKLSDRQIMFAKEYLVDLNATQAATRAGYSKKSARQSGMKNMTNPAIVAEKARGSRRSEICQMRPSPQKIARRLGAPSY